MEGSNEKGAYPRTHTTYFIACSCKLILVIINKRSKAHVNDFPKRCFNYCFY